ncbi:MAG TPA: hypothetical protein VLA56_12205 [Pseudomonadales bacterium]|nr:hypothetical protein [Pseudomonadales bacterium]
MTRRAPAAGALGACVRLLRALLVGASLPALVACGGAQRAADARTDEAAFDVEAPLPGKLSELRLLRRDGDALRAVDGVAYDLGHPLFSDYAWKYRTLHLPAGARAVRAGSGADTDTLVFPVGTLITKTFYYPRAGAGAGVVLAAAAPLAGPDAPLDVAGRRLIETRVLVHRRDGWDAVSYLWNEAGTDARRVRGGALLDLETADGRAFAYLVPDANQCANCHATDHGSRAIAPIGPKPGNLAAVRFAAARTQYDALREAGVVDDGAPVSAWPAHADARAYLDANCAHCHSRVGAADTAGLDLRIGADARAVGVCKSPVAAGRGSGGRAYDVWPGRPAASILLYRMTDTDPGVMMPELGRSLVHEAGVALITDWIANMEGNCAQGSLL